MNQIYFNKYFPLLIYIILGYCAFVGMMGQSTLGDFHPEINHLMHRIQKVFSWILILGFVYQSFTNGCGKWQYIVFFLFLLNLAFSRTHTWLIFDILFVPLLLSSFVTSDRVYKIYFFVCLFTTFFIFFLYGIDYLPTLSFKKFLLDKAYTLGFRHPNNFGFTFYLLSVLYFLIRKKFCTTDLIVLLVSFLLCLFFTQSRTASIEIFVLIIFSVICIYKKDIFFKNKKAVFYSSLVFYLILIVILYFLALSEFGRYSFFEKYVGTFAARLYMGQEALLKYGFSLIGQKVHLIGDYEAINGIRYFVVDCFYFYSPIVIGIIPTLAIIICHIIALKRTIYKENLRLYFVQILFIIFEMIEVTTIKTGFVLLMFMFPFCDLWKKSSYEES
ncbi:hypothetical protein [Succinivibrio dextrinosolvens]|uniref:hypothetical protein n=1 Tax=Succinivibrio dextrinosolvens TaxID=83771 RepID=UPI00192308E3|nr:hypothetical protein [Succinivibrio dextrinosolvens]